MNVDTPEVLPPEGDGEQLPAVRKCKQPIWRGEISKLLPCVFTEDEMRERAQRLTQCTLEIARKEQEKKDLTASITSVIKSQKTIQSDLARELDKGGEQRMVTCETIMDLGRNLFVCVRKDTGEIIESRELTEKERQGRLL
jgi:hypothetical protein